MINCYSLLLHEKEERVRVFYKLGIPLLATKNGRLLLSGVNQILFYSNKAGPVKLPKTEGAYTTQELKQIFADVNAPWIGIDPEGKYEIFSCYITEANLYVKKYSDNVLYVMLEAPAMVRSVWKTPVLRHLVTRQVPV